MRAQQPGDPYVGGTAEAESGKSSSSLARSEGGAFQAPVEYIERPSPTPPQPQVVMGGYCRCALIPDSGRSSEGAATPSLPAVSADTTFSDRKDGEDTIPASTPTVYDAAQIEADVREMVRLASEAGFEGPYELIHAPRSWSLGEMQLTATVVFNSCDTEQPTTIYFDVEHLPTSSIYDFYLTQAADGAVTTHYPDGKQCACPVVPDDSIHAAQLSAHLNAVYTPARHRLEHELWHHLVGIYVYGDQSSPIIWREAHGVTHPPSVFCTGEYIDRMPSHEEWLVAALVHHMHNDPSYDYGARYYLTHERGIDVDRLLAIGSEMVSAVYPA